MDNPYRNYTLRDGRRIDFHTNTRPVHLKIQVARSPSDIDSWIRKQRPTVLGLDIEWKPMFDRTYHKASLLQLSSNDDVILIQLFQIPIPPSLKDLLADENVKKVGVGIHADAAKMLDDWDTPVNGVIDIGQGRSLAKVALAAINVRLTKNKYICRSNWENPVLTQAQVLYAALDAWVASESFAAMQRVQSAVA